MARPFKIDSQLMVPLDMVELEVDRLADEGWDGAFTFEGPNEPFYPLVRAARRTPLDLYTNVAIGLPRSPMQLAQQAWDLQKLSGGRFMLGLGSQIKPHITRRFGARWEKPVQQMRELVLATKAIFNCWEHDERLNFLGDFYELTLMTPMFNPGPHPDGLPPIWVGALGPNMTRMVAEVADGLLIMPFNTRRHIETRTLPIVQEGLTAAGRDPADLAIICEAILCVGRDEQEMEQAEAGARGLLSFYGSTPSYRPVLEAHGWGDLQPELNRLSKQGDWDTMGSLITDEILETIAVRGTPTEVAAELSTRFGDIADRVAVYTPYLVAPDTMSELLDGLT